MVYGVLSAVIASILWSINPSVIKRYGYGVSSIALNGLRALMAALFLLIPIILYGFRVELVLIGLLYILGSAIIGPGIGDVLYIKSIRSIGAGKSVVIGYTYVFIAQILAAIFLGEELGISLIIGTLLAMLGIYLVYRGEDNSDLCWRKILISLMPAIAWGVGSIVNKYALMYTDPLSLGFIRVIVLSFILLLPMYNSIPRSILSKRILFTAVVTGGLGYGIGMPLFLYAVDVVGVSVTVLATTLTPVLGRLFSILIAGEKIEPKGLLGTILVILGIIIGIGLST